MTTEERLKKVFKSGIKDPIKGNAKDSPEKNRRVRLEVPDGFTESGKAPYATKKQAATWDDIRDTYNHRETYGQPVGKAEEKVEKIQGGYRVRKSQKAIDSRGKTRTHMNDEYYSDKIKHKFDNNATPLKKLRESTSYDQMTGQMEKETIWQDSNGKQQRVIQRKHDGKWYSQNQMEKDPTRKGYYKPKDEYLPKEKRKNK